MPVSTLFKKVHKGLKEVYAHAEDLLEEERELNISEGLLNSVIQRYVTQKVDEIEDLHAKLGTNNQLTLFATIFVKGIRAKLSLNLELCQFHMAKEVQKMAFIQKAPAEIHEVTFTQVRKKFLYNLAMFYVRHIKQLDPAVYLLEKLDIIRVDRGLLVLDIHPYIQDNKKIMNSFKSFEIGHAEIRHTQLVINTNITLRGLMGVAGLAHEQHSEQNDEQTPFKIAHTAQDTAHL